MKSKIQWQRRGVNVQRTEVKNAFSQGSNGYFTEDRVEKFFLVLEKWVLDGRPDVSSFREAASNFLLKDELNGGPYNTKAFVASMKYCAGSAELDARGYEPTVVQEAEPKVDVHWFFNGKPVAYDVAERLFVYLMGKGTMTHQSRRLFEIFCEALTGGATLEEVTAWTFDLHSTAQVTNTHGFQYELELRALENQGRGEIRHMIEGGFTVVVDLVVF